MSKKSQTPWEEDLSLPYFPKLDQDLNTDVLIVGGGMAGILTAYLLAKKGKKVIVVESNRLLRGATLYTTAFLTHVLDTDFSELISLYGKNKAKLIWQSHKTAIDEIEKIVKRENIDCEFTRCSNFIYAASPDEYADLMTETKEMKSAGFKAKLDLKLLGFNNAGSIELTEQSKFHPIKFLEALVKICQDLGVQFYENTEVLSLNSSKTIIAKTKNYVVKAKHAIIATYDPLGNPKETFGKKGMYRSYVMELEIPRNKIPEGTYEDTHTPYHYFRIDKVGAKDRMIVGGEDNRKEIALPDRKNFSALQSYVKQLLGKSKYKIIRKWTGPILEPSDGLALIGEIKTNQFIATAFSGNGMTYSMISAMIIRDSIFEKPNKWKQLYDPKRKIKIKSFVSKAIDYGEEFLGGVVKNSLK